MPRKKKESVGAVRGSVGPQLGEPDRHFRALLSSLSLFQGRGSFTDLILCAEDGKVECHKAMLAPFSPLLRSMFRVSSERQAADVTGISLGGVKVRVLQQLIAFIYTGEFGGRGKEEVAALAEFLQLKVDLQEKEKEGKGVEAKESPATKGASWNDFIAENGASPAAPSPAPGRKRGRPATPAQQEAPVKKRGKIEDNVKAESLELDKAEDDKKMKSRAEKMRIGIKVKNLTRDSSREVLKYRDMDAVEEATMMEAALKKGKNGRKSGVEKVEKVDEAKVEKVVEEIKVSNVEDEPRGRGRTVAPLKLTLKKTPEKKPKVVEKKVEVVEKVKENGNDVFEVERILDERIGNDKKKEYFVKWKGWNSPEDNTWEPEDSLGKSKKLIKEFEKRVEEINKKKLEEINKKKVASALGEESDGSDGVEILEEQRTPPKADLKKGRKSKTVAAIDVNVSADASSAKKGRKKKGDLDTTLVVETPSDKKEKKKKAEAEPVDDEYEVEKVLEKRETKSGTEYLVKWKGWEEEKDRTWEPQGNLKGSEKLIKKFESSSAKEGAPTPPSEEGVALCDICNRIFLSQDSLKNHSKEHKAKKKSLASTTPTPKSKRIKDLVESTPEETSVTKSESSGLECFKCGKDCKSKIELKHHVLSHFYPEFYAQLPSSKPFSCPICNSVSRDRITLVRHFAFVHEEIYKHCTKEELSNSKSSDTPPAPHEDSDVEEIGIDKDDPFAGIKDNFEKAAAAPEPEAAPEEEPEPVVKYRPGPKSKKKSLIVKDPTPPPAPAVIPPPWRSETLDDDNEKVYNVEDSDDDDVVPPVKAASNAFSFDDIFGSSAAVAAPAVDQPVFNKDSDDEGEAYSAVTASVAELMGESDSEDI